MRSFSIKILVLVSLMWCFWHFLWVCSLYYLTLSSTVQYLPLATSAIAIWLSFLVIFLLIASWLTNKPRIVLRSLEAASPEVDNETLLAATRICLRLPASGAILSTVFWIISAVLLLFIWSWQGLAPLVALSTMVGGFAGAVAVSAALFGLIMIAVGKPVSLFIKQLELRGINNLEHSSSIRKKLGYAFVALATGYTIWLGGLGLYTGFRQFVSSTAQTEKIRIENIAGVLQNQTPALNQEQSLQREDQYDLQQVSRVFASGNPDDLIALLDTSGQILASNTEQDLFPTGSAVPGDYIKQKILQEQSGSIFDNTRLVQITWFRLSNQKILVLATSVAHWMAEMNMFWFWISIFLLAGFLVSGILAYSFSTGNIQSVKAIDNVVSAAIGDGGRLNLGFQTSVLNMDEVGVLAINYNRLNLQLSNMITSIRENAVVISQSVNLLTETSGQLNTGAHSQAASIQQASAALEEFAASINDISNRVEIQAGSVRNVVASVKNLNNIIENVSANASIVKARSEESMQQAVEAAIASQESISGIANIEKRSNDILNIVGVINDISEQTNLLALNASIEAARAGDSGRGFAVVAEQISRLAENSSKATSEIESLVRETRSSISSGSEKVYKMHKIMETMKSASAVTHDKGVEVEKSAIEQLKLADEVFSSMQEIDRIFNALASAGKEQSNTFTEFSRSLEQINAGTQITAASADDIKMALNDIQVQVGSLNAFTRTFQLAENNE